MAQINIINLSELKGSKRVDADRYNIEYLDLENNISNLPISEKLINIISKPVRTGHTPKDRIIDYNDDIVHFVKTDVIREGLINFSNSDLLPRRCLSENHYLIPNEVTVTIIGGSYNVVGRAGIYLNNDPLSAVNQNIAVIRVDENKINPHYFMAFLNSKFGRKQLWMLSRRTEQVNLNCREVEELSVPLFNSEFQEEIEKLVKSAYALDNESKKVYLQAETLLLEELGLKNFNVEYEKSYVSNLYNVFHANRLDAEYFYPVYDKVIELINPELEIKSFKKLADRMKIKIKPNKEEFYKYIEIGNINVDIGEINYTERKGDELPENAKIPINGEELIISKVRPTRGAIGIIPKDLYDNVICSSAFSVFSVESPLKEYLYILVRSIIGKLQMERPTTGTSYPTIKDINVENIKIPLLPEESQQKFAVLVKKSHDSQKKSKELLKEAIIKIEEAIENEIKKS